MAKYFLGSVGKAEAFRFNTTTKQLELAFVSKTLTDSGLNISTTKDDIRGGQGAPIQFSFYHDPSVEITLTDIVWKPEYLTAQLGKAFEIGKSEDYVVDKITFASGEGSTSTLTHTPAQVQTPCGKQYLFWGAKVGTDEYVLLTYDSENSKLIAKNEAGATITSFEGEVCVRYLGEVNNSLEAEITSLIIPQELFLVITAPIFAGDACAASKGKAAGHITFEVPRFQLNGAQEFSMNMSQNQTMSLAGIALASESTECNSEGGKLLRIIEVIDDRNYLSDISEIIADGDNLVVGQVPLVFGLFKNGELIKLDNSKLTFTLKDTPTTSVIDGEGKFTAAAGTAGTNGVVIKLTGTLISDEVTVAPAE